MQILEPSNVLTHWSIGLWGWLTPFVLILLIVCIQKEGKHKTNNPCPICRDEYLILDYRNVKLLKHFVCQKTDAILTTQ